MPQLGDAVLTQSAFAAAVRALRLGSDPWEPVATRRGFTGLLDAVLAGLHNPAGCSVTATRVLGAHRLAEQMLQSLRPAPA